MLPLHEVNDYRTELNRGLPRDLPNREPVVEMSARHLARMSEVNQHLNLTRIVEPREAAVKHVLDSVLPWRLLEPYTTLADIGSGAGFPGVPLALTFPDKRFLLIESVGKKARFLSELVTELGLPNVSVHAARAEELLRVEKADVLIARAVASCDKLLKLLRPVLQGRALLLYKGADVEPELREAAAEAERQKRKPRILMRYELPHGAGARSIIAL
jgi:16S rRNA (guanine527-N7)-methyltransferase